MTWSINEHTSIEGILYTSIEGILYASIEGILYRRGVNKIRWG